MNVENLRSEVKDLRDKERRANSDKIMHEAIWTIGFLMFSSTISFVIFILAIR